MSSHSNSDSDSTELFSEIRRQNLLKEIEKRGIPQLPSQNQRQDSPTMSDKKTGHQEAMSLLNKSLNRSGNTSGSQKQKQKGKGPKVIHSPLNVLVQNAGADVQVAPTPLGFEFNTDDFRSSMTPHALFEHGRVAANVLDEAAANLSQVEPPEDFSQVSMGLNESVTRTVQQKERTTSTPKTPGAKTPQQGQIKAPTGAPLNLNFSYIGVQSPLAKPEESDATKIFGKGSKIGRTPPKGTKTATITSQQQPQDTRPPQSSSPVDKTMEDLKDLDPSFEHQDIIPKVKFDQLSITTKGNRSQKEKDLGSKQQSWADEMDSNNGDTSGSYVEDEEVTFPFWYPKDIVIPKGLGYLIARNNPKFAKWTKGHVLKDVIAYYEKVVSKSDKILSTLIQGAPTRNEVVSQAFTKLGKLWGDLDEDLGENFMAYSIPSALPDVTVTMRVIVPFLFPSNPETFSVFPKIISCTWRLLAVVQEGQNVSLQKDMRDISIAMGGMIDHVSALGTILADDHRSLLSIIRRIEAQSVTADLAKEVPVYTGVQTIPFPKDADQKAAEARNFASHPNRAKTTHTYVGSGKAIYLASEIVVLDDGDVPSPTLTARYYAHNRSDFSDLMTRLAFVGGNALVMIASVRHHAVVTEILTNMKQLHRENKAAISQAAVQEIARKMLQRANENNQIGDPIIVGVTYAFSAPDMSDAVVSIDS